MKTGGEVERDVYLLLAQSSLVSTIAGTLYRSGDRPLNARTEDAVISFNTGVDGQFEEGFLTLNIYVPDMVKRDGRKGKNTVRCTELEILAGSIIKGIPVGEYRFWLENIPQTFKAEQEMEQHFVNIKIRFELVTF